MDRASGRIMIIGKFVFLCKRFVIGSLPRESSSSGQDPLLKHWFMFCLLRSSLSKRYHPERSFYQFAVIPKDRRHPATVPKETVSSPRPLRKKLYHRAITLKHSSLTLLSHRKKLDYPVITPKEAGSPCYRPRKLVCRHGTT